MAFNFNPTANVNQPANVPSNGFTFNINPAPNANIANQNTGFKFNANANTTTAATTTAPATNTFGFNAAPSYSAPKPTIPQQDPQRCFVGIQQFSEKNAAKAVNALQYYNSQLTTQNQGSFNQTFYIPKAPQAQPSTSGFNNYTSISNVQKPNLGLSQAQNYDFNQLQPFQAGNYSELASKLKQTVQDSQKVAEKGQTCLNELSQVQNQNNEILNELNQLMEVQQIIKIELFKRFQLNDYKADVQINQMVEKLQQIEQSGVFHTAQEENKQLTKEIMALEPQITQQENQIVDLIQISTK